MRLVYSNRYNIGFFGLERMHPFDSRKYGRAWRVLRNRFGERLRRIAMQPSSSASKELLRLVHSEDYLKRLRNSQYVAQALELAPLRNAPIWMLDWSVLRPMRWAVAGAVQAAAAALEHGVAVNLGGGYHHAKPDEGEGFCIYSDIAIAVRDLRRRRLLEADSRIAYIDLDAHQGNGVCHVFRDDRTAFLFDMYNPRIYPASDIEAKDRIDCDVPLPKDCADSEYLDLLTSKLPSFLDSISDSTPVRLAIYNAGTDIVCDDPLGGLAVSADGVRTRDQFVIEQLRERRIPTVMLLSGGYTKTSFQLVADSVSDMIQADW